MRIFAKYDLLRFSQPEPELPPCGELLLLREVELHLLARVPDHEGDGQGDVDRDEVEVQGDNYPRVDDEVPTTKQYLKIIIQ